MGFLTMLRQSPVLPGSLYIQFLECEKAVDMAIEALTYQNLSKPNTTCEVDIISRADAIEAVRKELVCDGRHETHDKVCRFIADVILTALPSADIYCPSCGIRLVSEHEYVEPPYKGGDTE